MLGKLWGGYAYGLITDDSRIQCKNCSGAYDRTTSDSKRCDYRITGHSIVFTYTPAALKPTAELIQDFEALIKGDFLAPAEIEQKLSKKFRLLGPQGLVGIALAAIDMAVWDALARIHQMPLVRLLGGMEKPIRAYGAVGYDGVQGSGTVAENWAKRGFTGVKAKIGY